MTKEEQMAILRGERLRVETARVSGVYADGTPYERTYELNINMHPGDKFHFDLKIDYPKDLNDRIKPRAL